MGVIGTPGRPIPPGGESDLLLRAATQEVQDRGFIVASRAASEGRNPRTGEKIKIAASKQAKFKPGKGLRDSLN